MKQPILSTEEAAIISIYREIAQQSKTDYQLARKLTVIMDCTYICECKKSKEGVQGVATISNQPYAVIRGVCKYCGVNHIEAINKKSWN